MSAELEVHPSHRDKTKKTHHNPQASVTTIHHFEIIHRIGNYFL
jgi:hypothetical protein